MCTRLGELDSSTRIEMHGHRPSLSLYHPSILRIDLRSPAAISWPGLKASQKPLWALRGVQLNWEWTSNPCDPAALISKSAVCGAVRSWHRGRLEEITEGQRAVSVPRVRVHANERPQSLRMHASTRAQLSLLATGINLCLRSTLHSLLLKSTLYSHLQT